MCHNRVMSRGFGEKCRFVTSRGVEVEMTRSRERSSEEVDDLEPDQSHIRH